jgi:uncharacterized protein (TIGR03083 family)
VPRDVDLPPSACLEHLESGAARFSAVLGGADLAAPVPSCGDWRLLDLTHHLGEVHRWARVAVLEGHPKGASDDPPDGPPAERDELVAWFGEGVAALLTTLRDAGPDAPCWSFGPKPRTAAFWFRRQAHETSMHARDAEAACGAPGSLAADLALDGIDEALTMFLPRQVRSGRTVLPGTRVALASEEGPAWEIAGDDAPAEPAATVHGGAEALLLLVWGRIGADDERIAVTGDRGALDAVLAAGVTP